LHIWYHRALVLCVPPAFLICQLEVCLPFWNLGSSSYARRTSKPKHISQLQSGGQIMLRNTGHSILNRSIRNSQVLCLLVFLPPPGNSVFCSKIDPERSSAARISSGDRQNWRCLSPLALFGIHYCTDFIGFSGLFPLLWVKTLRKSDRVLTWRCSSSSCNGVWRGECHSKGQPCCLFPVCPAILKWNLCKYSIQRHCRLDRLGYVLEWINGLWSVMTVKRGTSKQQCHTLRAYTTANNSCLPFVYLTSSGISLRLSLGYGSALL